MIKNFFYPETVAVIGASNEEGKVGYSLMKNLENFKGKIIPVNIKHDEIFGLKAHKSVLDYEENIDLAVIAVPSGVAISVLRECGKKKIPNAIIITAGFSEIGNFKDEETLKDIAKKYNIQLLGPNCFGVCNPYTNLDTTFALKTPEKGDIAFVSQSGALWSYISDLSIGKFGFSGFASLGNMAGKGFEDFIDYFSNDDKTKAIVLYVEKLNNGRKFMEVCKKCKKPIYAVKVGSSKKGSLAAISHTASLASDYEIYKGAFKQANVILCPTLEQCFQRALNKKFVYRGIRKINLGKKTVIITNAGGAGALVSDYCSLKGIELVDWEEKNPLDILGAAKAADYKKALEKLKNKSFYDFVIVILTPQNMSQIKETAQEIISFSKERKKVVALFLGGQSVLEARKMLELNKVRCFNIIEEADMSL